MRFITFSATIFFIIVAFCPNADALFIDLHPPKTHFEIGESFDMEVWANDALMPGNEVIAFGFDFIISDPSVFSFNGWDVAASFDDDSGFFPQTDVAGSTFPGLLSDSILLATLHLTATSAGNATVGIFSDISDFNEGLTYSLSGNIDITSTINLSSTPAPVPEPATFVLLFTGLTAILSFRKISVRK